MRYLLLVAALLSPRPPALMVLNEPEASLHPELLPSLARLIARAAERSQVIVVSHASALVSALEKRGDCTRIALRKYFGKLSSIRRISRPGPGRRAVDRERGLDFAFLHVPQSE